MFTTARNLDSLQPPMTRSQADRKKAALIGGRILASPTGDFGGSIGGSSGESYARLRRMDVILYSVPVFLVAIAWEWAIARRRDIGVFRFDDSVTNLAIAVFSEIAGLVVKLVKVAMYTLVFHLSVVDPLPSTWPVWCGAFLAIDFLYYWFHRLSHEWNGLWAFHVVHHQSEEYNLTVALRQSAFGGLVGWVFYVPLALIGVSPIVFITCYSINLV